jgi:hypothetical protein
LNLSVQAIDRFVATMRDTPLSRLELGWEPASANVAFMAVWAVFFGVMASVGATDGTHRGDKIPFWEQACAEGRAHACERLVQIESTYCGDNAGWACNELGRHYVEGAITARDPDLALSYFSRACEARFQAGCVNLLHPESPSQSKPRALDLRLLLREGGANLMNMPEPDLYARACEHGWTFACQRPEVVSGEGP